MFKHYSTNNDDVDRIMSPRTVISVSSARRLQKYAAVLDALRRASQRVRMSVLSSAKKEFVQALVDCARLLIRNKWRLTENQKRQLRRRTDAIYDLVNPRTSLARRRVLLQSGGFIGALLGPALRLIGPVVGGLLGGIGGGRRR